MDLQGASNAAGVEKNRRPKGCAEFGLGLRCFTLMTTQAVGASLIFGNGKPTALSRIAG
jgi:hypothetical protein